VKATFAPRVVPASRQQAQWQRVNSSAAIVDQLLGGLFGSNDDDEPTRRRRARDYVDRYERGVYDQIGDDEVLQNSRTATAQLSPDEYYSAATDASRQLRRNNAGSCDGS
jgi:hypothetical protein